MKKTFFFIALLACFTFVKGQDTLVIYVDSNFNHIEKASAKYVREVIISNNHYKIKDKDLNGKNINYIECNSLNPFIEDGPAKHYLEPDVLYSSGEYKGGQLNGQWIYFCREPPDTVIYSTYNNLNSTAFQEFKKNNRIKKISKESDVRVTDSILAFLHKNFNFPARTRSKTKNIEQEIKLLLDTDGRIKGSKFNKLEDSDLEIELMRILNLYQCNLNLELPCELKFLFFYYEPSSREKIIGDPNPAYVVVEHKPEFKNIYYDNDFNKYLNGRLRDLKFDCFERIPVNFIIETDGSLSNVVFPLGIYGCSKYSEEIKNILLSSPPWVPGKTQGKLQRVKFLISIQVLPQKE